MQVEIRRATPDEVQAAYAIVAEYYEAVHVVARDNEDAFRKDYFGSSSGIWLARAGGELAGCIALRPLPTARCAEIKRMYVRPHWRGAGIAQKLLQEAERFAGQCGYEWIYLDTTDEMAAAASVYERNGYQRCQRYNDNPQATIFMRKNLIKP